MLNYTTAQFYNGWTIVNWKLKDGRVIEVSMGDLKKAANAVMKYVNDCFGNEKALITALDAATDLSAVDLNSGWPSTTVAVHFV